MIVDIAIPFVFGLIVGAGFGVMLAALVGANGRDKPYRTGARIGRWLVLSDHTVECPECGKTFFDAYDVDQADHYCRNCGANMRE